MEESSAVAWEGNIKSIRVMKKTQHVLRGNDLLKVIPKPKREIVGAPSGSIKNPKSTGPVMNTRNQSPLPIFRES